jgi:hypothetical protein
MFRNVNGRSSDSSIDRRTFAAVLAGTALAADEWAASGAPTCAAPAHRFAADAPAYSVVPVVGDGRWIWTEPPREGRGMLEPRRFRLRVGIEITANGPMADLLASTAVPAQFPEQTIESERIVTAGGAQAEFDSLSESARRLVVTTGEMQKGQTASAHAEFELTLYKQYFGFHRDQFPERQMPPFPIRTAFQGDSPGIQTRVVDVIELARSLRAGLTHPWDWAEAFADWVSRNIKPQIGVYTSVTKALETRVGDCEEMAGVFVALCRASGIPARLVWVPNHVWSEFYLVDLQGAGRWIPVHTACYSWFGWTGAHELVLQKGDRLRVPGYGTLVRLQQDRTRSIGSKPEVQFVAELTPLPPADADPTNAGQSNAGQSNVGQSNTAKNDTAKNNTDKNNTDKNDAGPGARRKMPSGEWVITSEHPADRYMRR